MKKFHKNQIYYDLPNGNNNAAQISANESECLLLCLDKDGRILYYNKKVENITGMNYECCKGKSWFDEFVAEEERKEEKKLFQKTIQAGGSKANATKIISKSGKVFKIQWFYKVIKPDDSSINILASGYDTSTFVRSDKIIEMVSNILEGSEDAVFVADKNGLIEKWNISAEKLFGIGHKDVLGSSLNFISLSGRKISLKEIIRKSSYNGETFIFDSKFRKQDGNFIRIRKHVFSLKDSDGNKESFGFIVKNLTGMVVNEQKFRESKLFNLSVIQSIQEGILVLDRSKKVKIWNKSLERWTGVNSSEITGHKFTEFFDSKIGSVFDEYFKKGITGELFYDNHDFDEMSFLNIKGWYSIIVAPHFSVDGEIIGVIFTIRDMTSQKESESKLEESENRFRELFNNMSNGVAVYTAVEGGRNFVVQNINEAGLKIEKKKSCDIIGKSAKEAFPEMLHTGIFDIFKEVYRTGIPGDMMFTSMSDDEIIGWRQYYIYKLPTTEIVSIFDDVTETKLAVEALQKSEDNFRTLVTAAPDGIALIKMPGTIKEMNSAFARLLGLSRIEMIGTNIMDLIRDDKGNKVLDELLDILQKKRYITAKRVNIISKNSSVVPVELSAKAIYKSKRKIDKIILVIRDITYRLMAENELKESREEMRKLATYISNVREDEKKKIAFEIHDDLGYALTAMKMDLKWLQKKMDSCNQNVEDKLVDMTTLLDETIQKVRDLSTRLRPSVLDHFGIIAAIEWQAAEFQKHFSVRCRIHSEISDLDLDDQTSTALFRIVQESLTNIGKHANARRVDLNIYIRSGKLFMKIIDNGIGMIKGSESGSHSLGVLGMKEKARSIGADLSISNNPEGGTCVKIQLPVSINKKN